MYSIPISIVSDRKLNMISLFIFFSKSELDHCFLSCHISGALTLLHAMDRFRPELIKKKNLVIHIVGANMYEILGLIKWECKYFIYTNS